MREFDYINNEKEEQSYPQYFKVWDEAVKKGANPGYVEMEDIIDIIDIYLSEGQVNKAKFAIDHAFKIYPGSEDLVYEVLLLLNDYELWNDLLTLSENYNNEDQVWADGHKITALLHLGMEEDAFHFFKKMKSKYAGNDDELSIIYQAMGEALYEVDLYDASIDVINEVISILGQESDLLWLQLQSYLALDDTDSVEQLSEQIQKMNPHNAEIWQRLGNIYKEINNVPKEIEAFEFAYSLGLKDSEMLLEMIYAYEKNGNLNKALEKIKEYLLLYPDSYLVNLMGSNISSQTGDWIQALEYIEKAILLEPSTESLYVYKSNFLIHLNEPKKAIMALEDGIRKTSDLNGDLLKQLKLLYRKYPDN